MIEEIEVFREEQFDGEWLNLKRIGSLGSLKS